MTLHTELNVTREKHDKEWGYEDWLVNSEEKNLCGKRLILHRQTHCSLHYHKIKTELFYVNKGLVLMEFDGRKGVMKPGDTLLITTEKRHRFTGITDAEIIEFSTFHRDSDSHREQPSGKWTDEEFKKMLDEHKAEIEKFHAFGK